MDFNLQTFLFWAIAGLTGLCAVMVVVTQNIVRSAAWLLFTLGGTAGIFFLLGRDFIGSAQLLIYVGGTLVLVVFGVMLTAQGPFITMKTGAAEWAFGTVVGLLLYGAIAYAVVGRPFADTWPGLLAATDPDAKAKANVDPATVHTSETIGLGFLNVTTATPGGRLTGPPLKVTAASAVVGGLTAGGEGQLPERKKMGYLLPFEIVSVHLLVVLVGAVLFVCGVLCMALKRNAIGVLMGVELVLNGANVNFVAFSYYNPTFDVEGQIFALFVIVLAAAEAAVALAIVLNFYNNHMTVDVDTAEELKG
jgi:NADH-quinone oxidoreductase subunit K